LAAEEYSEHNASPELLTHDAVIGEVMSAVRGHLSDGASQHLQELQLEGSDALEVHARDSQARRARNLVAGYDAAAFDWRGVLKDHLHHQRRFFERRMGTVQKAYIGFRILADRR
jgi:hypothetical protein